MTSLRSLISNCDNLRNISPISIMNDILKKGRPGHNASWTYIRMSQIFTVLMENQPIFISFTASRNILEVGQALTLNWSYQYCNTLYNDTAVQNMRCIANIFENDDILWYADIHQNTGSVNVSMDHPTTKIYQLKIRSLCKNIDSDPIEVRWEEPEEPVEPEPQHPTQNVYPLSGLVINNNYVTSLKLFKQEITISDINPDLIEIGTIPVGNSWTVIFEENHYYRLWAYEGNTGNLEWKWNSPDLVSSYIGDPTKPLGHADVH